MSNSDPHAAAATRSQMEGNPGTLARLRSLIAGDRARVLRELDDFLLNDIGASGDDIWRVHRLRNGERPTLLVG